MAIAIDQASLGTLLDSSGDSPISLVTTAAAAALSHVIVVVASDVAPSAISVGGTAAARDRTHTNGAIMEVWSAYKTTGMASSSAIAITFGSPPNIVEATALSFTGVTNTSPLDQVNSRSASNTQAWTSGSVTPSEANTVVVGVFHSGGGDDSRSTPTAGWTDAQDERISGDNRVVTYQVVPDTAARNPGGTFVSAQAADQIGITVNYKAVAVSSYHTKMSLLHVG